MRINSLLIFSVYLFLISQTRLSASDGDFKIKGILTENNKIQYEAWLKSALKAFNEKIAPELQTLKATLYIDKKKNAWPITRIFYQEAFYEAQSLKMSSKKLIFYPLKEIPQMQNNEYAFKRGIAQFLIKQNFTNKTPLWFEEGLSAWLAHYAGADAWVDRNYEYFLLVSSENNALQSIDQILNYKFVFDNKDKYTQNAYSFAFINWLMDKNLLALNTEKLIDCKSLEQLEQITGLNDLKEEWNFYLKSRIFNRLPKDIIISLNETKELNTEDVEKLFAILLENTEYVKEESIVEKFTFKISPETHKSISSFLNHEKEAYRMLSAKILRLIADRSHLQKLAKMSYSDESEIVRKQSALAVKELNMDIAPQSLVYGLHAKAAHDVAQAALALAEIGDPAPARNLIKSLAHSGPTTSYIAITTTQNYVADYDVVDGVIEPVVKTFHEGVVLEATVLWTTIVKPKLISSLNQLPLGLTSNKAEDWYKWYASQ